MKQKTWFWTERARACAATRPRSMKGIAWPERPRRLSTITTNATQRLRTKKKRFAKCDETVCVRLLLFSLIVCVCAHKQPEAARSVRRSRGSFRVLGGRLNGDRTSSGSPELVRFCGFRSSTAKRDNFSLGQIRRDSAGERTLTVQY